MYAPSRRSSARYVSRAFSRFDSGASEVSSGDDLVPLGDAVPGGGEREEDRYDRLACLLSVRRDGVEEFRPRRESMQVKLQPGEHAVADTDRLPVTRAGG